LIYLEFTT